ncbi:glycosyltransferase [Bacteroidia bacterium]|nr:glycosyltransferase [Bacteroidia bacterium]
MIKRVAVVAYACDPYGGSEGAVGWSMVSALAEKFELIVIVEKDKFEHLIIKAIEENITKLKIEQFVFISRSRWNNLRKLWPPSYFVSYRIWQRKARSFLEENISEYDLIYHSTLVGYRTPGDYYKVGKPVYWGPVGGSGYFSFKYFQYISLYGKAYYTAYNIFNFLQLNLSIRLANNISGIRKGGGKIFAADLENYERLSSRYGPIDGFFSEVSTPEVIDFEHHSIDEHRLLWVGLLEDRKGFELALEIMRKLKNTPYYLEVYGTGKQKARYEKIVSDDDLNINFVGRVSREDILQKMTTSRCLLFTSFRDLTATVTVEANSMGLPIVAIRHCGYGHWLNKRYNSWIGKDEKSSALAQSFVFAINWTGHTDVRNRKALQTWTRNSFSKHLKVQQLLDD